VFRSEWLINFGIEITGNLLSEFIRSMNNLSTKFENRMNERQSRNKAVWGSVRSQTTNHSPYRDFILYRFWDVASYWSKIAKFSIPRVFGSSHWGKSNGFYQDLWLPRGVDCVAYVQSYIVVAMTYGRRCVAGSFHHHESPQSLIYKLTPTNLLLIPQCRQTRITAAPALSCFTVQRHDIELRIM